jgi:uncharacterized protein YndB with AHSA1/START domain
MADVRVARDVEIEAPIDVVWRTVTEPEQVAKWFADRVELDLVPGGHGYMGFGEHQGGPVVVETVDPPNRFSYRWNHPAGQQPMATNSWLVEFTLTPRGTERTHLQVVESADGRLAWPDDEKARYADEHDGGWAKFLDRLAGLFTEQRAR